MVKHYNHERFLLLVLDMSPKTYKNIFGSLFRRGQKYGDEMNGGDDDVVLL